MLRRASQFISKTSERGAALLEAAIVIPFLVILVFGILDVAPAIHDYLQLTQVTHETLRFASSTVSLPATKTGASPPVYFRYESGFDYTTNPPTQNYLAQVDMATGTSTIVTTIPKEHSDAHARAAELIRLLGMNTRLEDIHILIDRDDRAATEEIGVTIEGNYRAFLGFIVKTPIRLRVSEHGPYLY